MSDFLYYCSKCNILILDKYEDDAIACDSCHSLMVPLHITEDQWDKLSEEEMRTILLECDTRRNRERRSESASARVKEVSLSNEEIDSDLNEEVLFSYSIHLESKQGARLSVFSDRVVISSTKENSTYKFEDIIEVKRFKLGLISIKLKSGRAISFTSSDRHVNASIGYIMQHISPTMNEVAKEDEQYPVSDSTSNYTTNELSLSDSIRNIDYGGDGLVNEVSDTTADLGPCGSDTDDDFIRKIKKLPYADTIFGKRDIKDMKKIMQPGETVKAVCSGIYQNKTWIFACTDRRVIAVNKNLVIGGDQIEIPFSQVHAMAIKRGLFLSTVSVQTGFRTHDIKNIENNAAKHFVDCVNRKIERIEGQFQSTPQVLTQVNQVSQVETLSDADELRKFKALLDEGIITEDEFNLKKKQILGL